jgi:hypothetical protein
MPPIASVKHDFTLHSTESFTFEAWINTVSLSEKQGVIAIDILISAPKGALRDAQNWGTDRTSKYSDGSEAFSTIKVPGHKYTSRGFLFTVQGEPNIPHQIESSRI